MHIAQKLARIAKLMRQGLTEREAALAVWSEPSSRRSSNAFASHEEVYATTERREPGSDFGEHQEAP